MEMKSSINEKEMETYTNKIKEYNENMINERNREKEEWKKMKIEEKKDTEDKHKALEIKYNETIKQFEKERKIFETQIRKIDQDAVQKLEGALLKIMDERTSMVDQRNLIEIERKKLANLRGNILKKPLFVFIFLCLNYFFL